MKIHVSMVSGQHFKIQTDDECNKFLNQLDADTMTHVEVMVDGWKMRLTRKYIESVSIREL